MNDGKLIFSGWTTYGHLFGILLLIIVAIVLIDFWKKEDNRRPLRLLSYSFIALSISALLLKPMYRTAQLAQEVILLTNGYEQETLDSLLKSKVEYKILSDILNDESQNIDYQQVKDVYHLKYSNNHFKSIHILGEGLSNYELAALKDYAVFFYPSKLPEGIIDVQFDRSVVAGKTTTIKGTLNRVEPTKIILLNNESKLDSVSSEGSFSFSIHPKVAGRFVYHLEEYVEDSLLSSHPVPIEVLPQRKLSVLIVNDYPMFDTKYLRDYLKKCEHQVVIRNRYSQKKFSYEHYNTNTSSRIDLSSDQLKDVDLLIIDDISLLNLSTKELRNISLMVKAYGLTVLLQNIRKPTNISKFRLFEGLSVKENNEAELLIQKGVSITKSPFKVSDSSIPITSSQSLNLLGGYKFSGIGKVGVLSFQNAYELVLNGYHTLYDNLWYDILEQISKRTEETLAIGFEDEFPTVNSPLNVYFENNTLQDYQLSIDSIKLSLKQDIQLPARWTGKFWAGEEGWHSLEVNNNLLKYKYIYNDPDWKILKTYRKMMNTRLFAKRDHDVLEEDVKFTYKSISPIIFYIIFLISIAYLWIETKL